MSRRTDPPPQVWRIDAGVTRLAPSPTGALHLGNARTFLINWAVGRQRGLRIDFKIDDVEGPRVKRDADSEAEHDLRWLGLDWDVVSPRPSTRRDVYGSALSRLAGAGHVFACDCTRSAPHAGVAADGSLIYGGRCRKNVVTPPLPGGVVLRVRATGVAAVAGFDASATYKMDLTTLGDFVVRRADGAFSYQLACTVDDFDANTTHVVRGRDLEASSLRQSFLRTLLAPDAPPMRHLHVPLVLGTDGRKLAKRHGDTRLAAFRDAGITPGQLRAVLARWGGFDLPDDATPEAWVEHFDHRWLPRHDVTCDPHTLGVQP